MPLGRPRLAMLPGSGRHRDATKQAKQAQQAQQTHPANDAARALKDTAPHTPRRPRHNHARERTLHARHASAGAALRLCAPRAGMRLAYPGPLGGGSAEACMRRPHDGVAVRGTV